MTPRVCLALFSVISSLTVLPVAYAQPDLSQQRVQQQCEQIIKERYPNRHLEIPKEVQFAHDEQVTTLALIYDAAPRGVMRFACHFDNKNGALIQMEDTP